MRLARYYLGRVLKHGLLDMVSNDHRIIYARLAKYSPVGEASKEVGSALDIGHESNGIGPS